jgi:2-amino-4-hydroxy-6-hydroxymethyldihydropteridine diphosphokinase
MTNEGGGNEVLLGLGANEGDPVAQLGAAVEALSRVMRMGGVSSLYRSEPVGFAEQADFYNVVVRGWTGLEPMALLAAAQEVEAALGRRRSFANAPRTIDVDLLAYGDRVMRTARCPT